MSILWNLFFALSGGLIGSVVGAQLTRRTMVDLQEREFRQRKDQALRALLVELENNDKLVFSMISQSDASLRLRLRRSIWDSQLLILAGHLKPDALGTIERAYYNLDFLMRDRAMAPAASTLNTTLQFLKEAATTVRRAAGLPEPPKQ